MVPIAGLFAFGTTLWDDGFQLPYRPSRQALFPMPTLGAPLSGAVSFPTPFSTASGVFGLVAGPSSALRTLDFE
jgi:hypothetical protein